MNSQWGAWGAWSRAISLARRIDARLYALLLAPPSAKPVATAGGNSTAGDVRKRLELLIELAKSEGVQVDYFISEGSYEEEVIRFVEQNRITLLVAESAEDENSNPERELAQIRRIGHRVTCRVELVSPRKTQNLCTGESDGHEFSTSSVSPNCRE
jgi:nucleotide-binding universal stress UspA family protein